MKIEKKANERKERWHNGYGGAHMLRVKTMYNVNSMGIDSMLFIKEANVQEKYILNWIEIFQCFFIFF